jgi:hypothetical protein
MKSPRALLLALITGLAAATVVLNPAFAEPLFGVITSVDLDENEVVLLTPRGNATEVKIKTTASTEVVTAHGDKIDLKVLKDAVAKEQQAGKKGAFAKVTYENKIASKITVGIAPTKPAK